MKKLLLIIAVFLFASITTFSQGVFGIKGGVNFANQTIEVGSVTINPTNSNLGFFGGITYENSFSDNLAFETGIFGNLSSLKDKEYSDEKTNLLSIYVPVYLKYLFDIGNDTKIYIGAGPYLEYFLSAKEKWDGGSADLDIGSSDTDDLKAFNYGLTFGAGVEISNFQIGASYDLGFADLSNDTDYKSKAKGVRFSVGYKFGK